MAEEPTARDEHPPSPPPRERLWLPVLGLLGVMLVVAFGGWVVAAEPGEAVGPPGEHEDPVEVVDGVTIRPLQGWEVVDTLTEPATGIRLHRGVVTLDVLGIAFDGSPDRLFDIYERDFLEPRAFWLSVAPGREAIGAGRALIGARGSYNGVFAALGPVEGEVSAVVGGGEHAVVADVYAVPGLLGPLLDQARLMVDTLEIEGAADVPAAEYEDPVEVAPGVSIRPLRGWEAVETFTDELEGVRLQRDEDFLFLDLFALATAGTGQFELYERDFLEPEAEGLRVSPERERFTTDRGLVGSRSSYTGDFRVAGSIEGEVSVIDMDTAIESRFGDRLWVVADAYAAPGELGPFLREVHLMVDTLEAE